MAAPLPQNEEERLEALKRYDILDTDPEEASDRLVELAGQMLDVPITLVSLVDDHRQCAKAARGIERGALPKEHSLCAHVIAEDEMLIVEDAREDARFVDNPFVTGDFGLKSYVGAPLRTKDGHILGTLCALDNERTRQYDEHELKFLEELANCVVAHMETRYAERIAQQERERAERASEAKSTFLANMSHELRTPLSAIFGYMYMIEEDVRLLCDDDTIIEDIEAAKRAGRDLLSQVEDILDLSRVEAGEFDLHIESFELREALRPVMEKVTPTLEDSGRTLRMDIDEDSIVLRADDAKIQRILICLIQNANTFAQGDEITIGASQTLNIEGDLAVWVWVEFNGLEAHDVEAQAFIEGIEAEEGTHNPSPRRYDGMGIAMTLSRIFCDMMDGRLFAEETDEGRQRLVVSLPQGNSATWLVM